jgi:hypothetical protein
MSDLLLEVRNGFLKQ